MSYTILSVGGSIIIPKTGFDLVFLKKFRALILREIKKGKKFILVIGGGATCRTYQDVARLVAPVSDVDLDWLGIKSTLLNAELVKYLFKGYADTTVVSDPTKKIKTNKAVIVAGGWKPGCSTDKDAVLLAKTYGAKEVFNLSNVAYIYDSDPKINKTAKKLEKVRWQELQKIVGKKWVPGANVPFDPSAVALAKQLKLTVGFVQGTDLDEVQKAVSGKPFAGTVIS